MHLHEVLRQLRQTSPLGRSSVSAAARELGLSRHTIYDWERQGSRPEPETLRRYLEYLGCSHTQIVYVLDLRSLPADATLDDLPTLAEDTPVAGGVS